MPPNEPETYDSPTARAAINQLSVEDLDAWLDHIRQRRLVLVQKLEAAAKVDADKTRLVTFMKFERQHAVAKRALTKLDELIARTEAVVHKTRLIALTVVLETDEQEESIDADTS